MFALLFLLNLLSREETQDFIDVSKLDNVLLNTSSLLTLINGYNVLKGIFPWLDLSPIGELFCYINDAVSPTFIPFPDYDGPSISKYFDPNQAIVSNKNLREELSEFKDIYADFYPEMSIILGIDKDIFEKLYNTIYNNDDNSNLTIESIFNILNLQTPIISKVKKILSVFDSHEPISLLFEAFDANEEFNYFISIKDSIVSQFSQVISDIRSQESGHPIENSDKNDSNDHQNTEQDDQSDDDDFDQNDKSSNIYLLYEAGINTIQACIINSLKLIYKELLEPILEKLIIHQFDYVEYPISSRFSSFLNLIDKISQYSDSDNPYKKEIYETTRDILSFIVYKDENEIEENDDQHLNDFESIFSRTITQERLSELKSNYNPFKKFKEIISIFYENDINDIIEILNDKYEIPSNLVLPLAQLYNTIKNIDLLTNQLLILQMIPNELKTMEYCSKIIQILVILDSKSSLVHSILSHKVGKDPYKVSLEYFLSLPVYVDQQNQRKISTEFPEKLDNLTFCESFIKQIKEELIDCLPYIYKQNELINPKLTISTEAALQINLIICQTFKRIVNESLKLISKNDHKKIGYAQIEAVIKSSFPAELANNVVEQGQMFLEKYKIYRDEKSEKESIEIIEDELHFSIQIVTDILKEMKLSDDDDDEIGNDTAVYLSAAVSYLSSRLLEMAGEETLKNDKSQISSQYAVNAWTSNQELVYFIIFLSK